MKKFINLALILCITMMCASPIEAQGQTKGRRGPEPSHRMESHHKQNPTFRPTPPPPAPAPRPRPRPLYRPHHTPVMDVLFDAAITAITLDACRDAIEQATEVATVVTDITGREATAGLNSSSGDPEIGTLFTKLPGDCQRVEFNGKVYYQVNETLYKVTVIDGTPYFEAACRL